MSGVDPVYTVYKKILIEKSLLWNLKLILNKNWAQLLCLISQLNMNCLVKLKYVTSRRMWILNILIIDFMRNKIYISKLAKQYIKWQITLWTYRGARHMSHLPVYGQRTRSNAKTNKVL